MFIENYKMYINVIKIRWQHCTGTEMGSLFQVIHMSKFPIMLYFQI